jgi:hypothetical protein
MIHGSYNIKFVRKLVDQPAKMFLLACLLVITNESTAPGPLKYGIKSST